MNVDTLISKLREIEKITNDEWVAGLDDRKKTELEFHDLDRDRSRLASIDQDTYERFYGNRKYYGGTGLSKEYLDDWLKAHVKNKIFLDYACGNGVIAIKAAKAGAALAIGIDLSSVSVENAKKDALREGVADTTFFLQADAENTKLPDASMNVIVCSGVLHHVELSIAFPELHRILTPGGRIMAIEALDYNPLIKLYRKFTPAMRTEWEKSHILSLVDVEYAKNYFMIGEIRYWHITSILYPYIKALLPLLNYVDNILTKTPLLKLMAWIFTFELIKSETSS